MPRTRWAHGAQSVLESADAFFKEGQFEKAKELYTEALRTEANNFRAALAVGHIALLENLLDEAVSRLKKAVDLKPDSVPAKQLLAEGYYRQDRFQEAAPLFRFIGSEAVAKKLESFKSVKPYKIDGKTKSSILKFVITDPLPLVRIRVNGGPGVNFLIDTGASEVYIDSDFAKESGVQTFGQTTGTYGGGLHSATGHGKLARLGLGSFTVYNVPVLILNTRRFAAAANGNQVDGVIGVQLLMHFISTLDYPGGRLILRRRNRQVLARLDRETSPKKSLTIPFWIAGDHYILASGRINRTKPLLLLVDTGLAGAGFTGPESTIKETGIDVSRGQEVEGVGGGGAVKSVPFTVNEISLGPATEHGIMGFLGPFPPSLEHNQGFRIGGIISHQFFRSYAVTFDFDGMKLLLDKH